MIRRAASLGLAALLLAGALSGCGGSSGTKGAPKPATYTSPPAALPVKPVSLSTAPPPWLPPAVVDNGAQSAAYVTAAGLPYAREMLQVHYHAHLDINVNGKAVTVPAYLGFVTNANNVIGLAPLHTHDNSGIVHIENSVPATFVLGQFFIEWGVRFTASCLGPYCTGGGNELAVYLNGNPYAGDATRLVLAKHQEIAIEFGKRGQLPTPPSSYNFQPGS
jgi:hypothetical protein